jgi:hypothetical protein
MKVVKAPYLANQDRARGLTIYKKFGPNPTLVFNAHSAAQKTGILFAREHSFWAQTRFVVLRLQRTRDRRFFATFFTFWRKARSLEDLMPDANQKKGREKELTGSLFLTCH